MLRGRSATGSRRHAPRTLAVLAVLAAVASAGTALAGCSAGASTATRRVGTCPARAAHATVGPVKADKQLTALWTNYALTNTGWTGGDSVFTYDVPGFGRLWTFADAYNRGLLPGGSRYGGIYHSMFVVQALGDGGGFRVVAGAGGRRALIGPVGGPVLYLSLAGMVAGSRFYEFFTARKRTGPESLQTVPFGSVLATFSLPGLHLLSTKSLGGDAHRIGWGAYVSRSGAYTYIYGSSAFGVHKAGFVARLRGTNLNGAWSYWDGHGWSASPAAARPFVGEVGQEYSVSRYQGIYVLISSDQRHPFSPNAVVAFGCSPTGPFGGRHRFLVSLAIGPIGRSIWHTSSVYVYDEVVQPALPAPPGDLLVSYNQNALDFNAILAQANIYRPGYLDLPITVPPAAAR